MAGKPGPALTFGVPLLLVGSAAYFGYSKLVKPALQDRVEIAQENAKEQKLKASTSTKKYATTIRVAGDPWSGYSTFRGGTKLTAALAKEDIGLQYVDDERLYDQNARMAALAKGEIDVALTTVDAFLQHGAKNRSAERLYPGVIVWAIDESNGGDAIFLGKGKKSFDDVGANDKVCYSAGTPSEHLWDFASLSFASLGENIAADPGVVAEDCWKKLKSGQVQVAVLWQPFTAIAEKEGYANVFATGGQADDVIVDIAVANRDFVIEKKAALQSLANNYFATIDTYMKDEPSHAQFITADCGADCNNDVTLGSAVLKGIDFLSYSENMCLWFGQCGSPAKMPGRIVKTSKLLVAKGKLQPNDVPDPASILNDTFLQSIKQTIEDKAKLAAEVAGDGTAIAAPALSAEERSFAYKADVAKGDTGADVGTLRLPSIYFRHGRADLDPNAQSVVAGIADSLRSFPALCVRVWGHTNSQGTPAVNKELSLRRAASIVLQLQALDKPAFPQSRFDVRGFGSERPVLKDGHEDLDASRRTEFKLFNCTAKP